MPNVRSQRLQMLISSEFSAAPRRVHGCRNVIFLFRWNCVQSLSMCMLFLCCGCTSGREVPDLPKPEQELQQLRMLFTITRFSKAVAADAATAFSTSS